MIEERPSPPGPDFLIRRLDKPERAAVEVTIFNWPRQISTWQRAMRSFIQRANATIAGQSVGQFHLYVEVSNQQLFSNHYRALSCAKRNAAVARFADQVVTLGPSMKVGEKTVICDPVVGFLIKSGDGGGLVTWGSTVDVGNNVEAIGRDLSEVVLRKAKNLAAFSEGLRMLVIHYYASSLLVLKLAATQLTVPGSVHEIYFVLHVGAEPRVVPCSLLDQALAAELDELTEAGH